MEFKFNTEQKLAQLRHTKLNLLNNQNLLNSAQKTSIHDEYLGIEKEMNEVLVEDQREQVDSITIKRILSEESSQQEPGTPLVDFASQIKGLGIKDIMDIDLDCISQETFNNFIDNCNITGSAPIPVVSPASQQPASGHGAPQQ